MRRMSASTYCGEKAESRLSSRNNRTRHHLSLCRMCFHRDILSPTDKMFLPHTFSFCDSNLCLGRDSVAYNESACLSMSITDYCPAAMTLHVYIHCKH